MLLLNGSVNLVNIMHAMCLAGRVVAVTSIVKRCSCGSCEEDEVKCDGREYTTKNPLTCPIHALAMRLSVTIEQHSHVTSHTLSLVRATLTCVRHHIMF